MDQCSECGFRYLVVDAPQAGPAIVDGVDELAALLTGQLDVRPRRDPATWSPLEYDCHVRARRLVEAARLPANVLARPATARLSDR